MHQHKLMVIFVCFEFEVVWMSVVILVVVFVCEAFSIADLRRMLLEAEACSLEDAIAEVDVEMEDDNDEDDVVVAVGPVMTCLPDLN